jgi:subtilisin family serine protease
MCLALVAVAAFVLTQREAAASRARVQGTTTPATQSAQSKARPFVPGEILVRFRGESAGLAAEAAVASLTAVEGGEIPVRIERARGLEIVRGLRLARVSAAETERALTALRARPDVLYAEPNYVRHKLSVPNDPQYPQQWAFKNNTQFGGGPGADIDAEQAWDITKGDHSVVVGVVDEGIDINHQDLQSNIWTNAGEIAGNGIDDDGNGYVDDVHGWDFFHNDASVYDGTPSESGIEATDAHGTHVAGIIGAAGNNGVGIASINWQVAQRAATCPCRYQPSRA